VSTNCILIFVIDAGLVTISSALSFTHFSFRSTQLQDRLLGVWKLTIEIAVTKCANLLTVSNRFFLVAILQNEERFSVLARHCTNLLRGDTASNNHKSKTVSSKP
jgi:hypothetical protein